MICDYFQVGGKGERQAPHPSNINQRDLDRGIAAVMAERRATLLALGIGEQCIWCPWGTWRRDGRKIPVRPDDPAPGWTDGLLDAIDENERAGIETVVYLGDIGESDTQQVTALWPVLERLGNLGHNTLVVFDHSSDPLPTETAVMLAARDLYGLRVGVEALPVHDAPHFDAAFAWASTADDQLQQGRRLHPQANYLWLNYDRASDAPEFWRIPRFRLTRGVRWMTNLDHHGAAMHIDEITAAVAAASGTPNQTRQADGNW